MPTNPYFNNFLNTEEQALLDSLVVESIKIYGLDVQYVHRVVLNEDSIVEDNKLSSFTSAYPVEMYIKSNEGFTGEGDFISKFGLTIRDRVTLTVSRDSFIASVTSHANTVIRPMEGDLIFLPLNHKLFEIKFVEHENPFYQLGALQTYDLICEVYEWNHEDFATGNSVIDSIYQGFNLPYDDPDSPDKDAHNTPIQTFANTVIDWTESSPFGAP